MQRKAILRPSSLPKSCRRKGFSVWYDTSLVPGDSFRDVIMSKLAEAKAAIVIWDQSSVKSDWVYSEADRARARRILIPVRTEDVSSRDIPPPFDCLHTELLSNRTAIEVALSKLGVLPVARSLQPAADFADTRAVAVLPFDNLSSDPGEGYFVDGLTEDIITALAYWRWFPVVARNSTFAYKGKPKNAKEMPQTKIVVCEPEDAQILSSGVDQARNSDGSPAAAHPAFKPHPMQGWTPDFIPKLTADAVKLNVIHRIIAVPGAEAIRCSAELASKEGILVGITAGATFAGALRMCADAPKGSTVLCMLPDTGERYLSTPLFANVSADMTPEELEISRSTPSAQFPS